MKKCLICNKRPAIKIEPYGYMPCKPCSKKQAKTLTNIEVTTEEIAESRRIYEKDIIQPFRGNYLSREYTKRYPGRIKQMIKEGNITEQDVIDSKDVWVETKYYKND